MTEEERHQQEWVELRADCTEQGVFKLIAGVVERDVESFNKLYPERRRDRIFKCERNELTSLYVGEVNDDGALIRTRAGITIQKHSEKIRIWRNQRCQFEIVQEWNETTLACDLKIDGECFSVWQISQKAIGDLLFGYG